MKYIYKDRSIQEWLHSIRYEETTEVMKFFPEGENLKVLDIGGGDGHIASIFSEKGYEVTSIDLNPRFPQSFPVQKAMGSKLSFPDKMFDVIFSSNVLEHVTELETLLKETKRVAKKDALMIHVMPTPAWRLITSFWYYLSIFKLFFEKIFGFKKGKEMRNTMPSNENDETESSKSKATLGKKLKKILLHPHGEYPSFIHELYYFSKRRWLKVFKRNNLECLHVYNCPLLYSGIFVFKFRFMKIRRYVARTFFTAGYIYISKDKK